MKIKYNFIDQVYSYVQNSEEEIEKLSFVLSNNKGDFLNMGVLKNPCKFNGLNICNVKTLEIFKILDDIILQGVNCKEVEYGGYFVKRTFASMLTHSLTVPVDEKIGDIEHLGSKGKLIYDDQGILKEQLLENNIVHPQDNFYLGPSGGVVYTIENYEGSIFIDLDLKKSGDFDEWGRDYNVYEKQGIILVEYTKKQAEKQDYKLYFGLKAVNFLYNLKKDFIKKEYPYSKMRNSMYERYVYRLLEAQIDGSKRIIMGAGFSEEEVLEQIILLENHTEELKNFDNNIFSDLIAKKNFAIPLSQDTDVAYRLSNNAIYRFLNKDLDSTKIKSGLFAGFPWFANVWTRDELVSLRAFINNGEENLVKKMLYNYLNLVDLNTGMITRIEKEGSFESADGCFWLAKRFEDFMYHLTREKRLNIVLTQGELEIVYAKFHLVFNKLVENFWDKENELLRARNGDSWMDTIDVKFPLDIQVQFLEMVSFISVLGQLLGKKEESEHIQDFEGLLRLKIKSAYFRGGVLYNEPFEDKITSNVFLAYYFYPNLFNNTDWEQIFDNALLHLQSTWAGISSLSQKDNQFKENYTGENNLSYHRGDVWFWINNIAAISLHDLNEKKYRNVISKILRSSTNDILKMGTIGFGSEISSFSHQTAQGCLAQLWSSSTYIEMIDKLFEKE